MKTGSRSSMADTRLPAAVALKRRLRSGHGSASAEEVPSVRLTTTVNCRLCGGVVFGGVVSLTDRPDIHDELEGCTTGLTSNDSNCL